MTKNTGRCIRIIIVLSLSLFHVGIGQSQRPTPAEAERKFGLGVPIVTIGLNETTPGHELFRVVSAKWRDGTLVVANAGSSQVRVFNSAGKLLNSFGSVGDGPGEFRALQDMWLGARDTVITFDGASQRLSFWSTKAKKPIREIKLSVDWSLASRLSDGSFIQVKQVVTARPGEGKSALDSVALGHLNAAWTATRELGHYPYLSRFGARIPNGPVIHTPLPLFPRAVWTGYGQSVVIGYPESAQLLLVPTGGGAPSAIRIPFQKQALTRESRKAWTDSLSATLPVSKPDAENYLRSLPYPEFLPVYDAVTTDELGNLWVRRFVVPGELRAEWVVLNSAGKPIGRITVPARDKVMHVGKDFIVMLRGGTDENESVVVFRMTR